MNPGFGAVNMEVPMFHDRHLGYLVTDFDALNRARRSQGLDPYQPPPKFQTGALFALALLVALLTMLVT
jgi:hypothetical protein